MAKNNKKTGNMPQNKSTDRGRRRKNDTSDQGTPKSGTGSGSLNQRSDRDVEDRFDEDAEIGSPKGSASRIDDEDDMDYRPKNR